MHSPVLRSMAGLLFAAAMLSGCVTVGGAPSTIPVPKTQAVDWQRLPADAQRVVAASLARLRGGTSAEIERTLGVAGTDKLTPEPAFRYEGFAVRQVKLLSYGPAAEGQDQRKLAALLHLEDPAGRRTGIAVSMVYAAGSPLRLSAAQWRPLHPHFPRTEMFVVPTDAISDAEMAAAVEDYRSLYALVASKAVRLKGGKLPAGRTDKAIFVFAKDRLSPDADLRVSVSEDPSASQGYEWGTRYRDYAGWRVAAIAGNFDLVGYDKFYVKAVYRPGADFPEEQRGERVVGLFDAVHRPESKPLW